MSSTDIDNKVKAELSRLIKEGSNLSGLTDSTSHTYSSKSFYKDVNSYLLSTENLLSKRFGMESLYYKHFIQMNGNITRIYSDDFVDSRFQETQNRISVQVGVLESALNDFEKGLIDDLFYEKELVVFNNMLDQAYEFLGFHLRFAAAVYGRIVLETAIREYAKLKLLNKYNPKMKFNDVIIELKTNKTILQTFEDSLRANYGIGNAAAHNKELDKYSDKDIKEFLNFIRDRVLTLS